VLGNRHKPFAVAFQASYAFDYGGSLQAVNLLAPELFFLILAHPIYKM